MWLLGSAKQTLGYGDNSLVLRIELLSNTSPLELKFEIYSNLSYSNLKHTDTFEAMCKIKA
jgi:hypothetical protein